MTRLTIILMTCLLVLFICSTHPGSAQEAPPTAAEILQKASEALDRIRDAKMIVEHFDPDGRLVCREEVEYKSPGMLRVSAVNVPYAMHYIYTSDGQTEWLYNRDDQTVNVSAVKESWRKPSLSAGIPSAFAPLHLIFSISPELAKEQYYIEYDGISEPGGRITHILKLREKLSQGQSSTRTAGDRTIRGDTSIYAVRKTSVPEGETGMVLILGIDAETSAITIRNQQRSYQDISKMEAVKLAEVADGIYLPVEFATEDPYSMMGSQAKFSDFVINQGIQDNRFTFEPPTGALIFDESILEKANENIAEYAEKVKASPEDAVLRYALIRLYESSSMDYQERERRKLPHAIELARLRPEMVKAYREIANAYSTLQRPEEAIPYVQKILELKPDMTTACIQLGRLYLVIDQPEEALKHLQKAMDLAPYLYESQYMMVDVYEKLGRPQDAIRECRRIMALDDKGPVRLDYQRLYTGEKLVSLCDETELRQVIAELQSKAEEYPENINLRMLIGLACERSGDKAKTVEAYRKVLELLSESEIYSWDFGYRLSSKIKSLGVYDDAIPFYEKQMETATGYTRMNIQRELLGLYVRQGNVDKCLAVYEDAAAQGQTEQILYSLRESGGSKFLEALQEKLAESPEDVRIYRLLGDVNTFYIFDRSNPAEAINMYQRALELAPEDAELSLSLAKVYNQQGNIQKAIELYKRAVEIKPDDPYYRAHLAYAYNTSGDHQEAIAIGEALLKENPGDASGHGVLATVYLNANMNAEAIAEYEKALNLTADRDPFGDGGFFQRGMAKVYEDTGEYEKADDLYDKLGNAMSFWDRTQLYMERGAYDRLQKYAMEKIKTGQDWEKQGVVQQLIQAFSRQGRMDELPELFRAAIEAEPDFPGNYCALGAIYKQQGKNPEAIEMYEKAIQLSPGDVESYIQLAEIHVNQGTFGEAAVLYEKAIKLQPGRTSIYPPLANAYAGLGQVEKIAEAAERMKKNTELEGYTLVSLGDVYMAGQFYDEAIAAYKKGLEESPGERYFQEKLLRCYQAAGKTEEARELQAEMGPGPDYGIPVVPKVKPAPDFTLKAVSGEEVALSKLRGKAVIINFFATWNPICRRETQDLEQLHQAYKDKGIAIIGASVDKDENAVRQFAQGLKITYPIVLAADELFSSYRALAGEESKTIPTTFIINSRGFLFGTLVAAQPKEVFEKNIQQLLEK